MESPMHSMPKLFAQLGLADDEAAIARFIDSHRPLPGNIALHQASFWNASQASFLREAIVDDADWAEVVDTLSAELRAPSVAFCQTP